MRLRALAIAAALAVVATAWPAESPPATAAPTCSGVGVVVDPGDLGPSASQRCATFDDAAYPVTGRQALQAAGHTLTFVGSTTFVCRIDGAPASDPCTRTPPATAYWSYWLADAGGNWRLSSQGVQGSRRQAGQADGWVFGDGSRPPRLAPPAPGGDAEPAPAPEPEPEPEPDPAPEPEPEPDPAPEPEPEPGPAPGQAPDPEPTRDPEPSTDRSSTDDPDDTATRPGQGAADPAGSADGGADRQSPEDAGADDPGADDADEQSDGLDAEPDAGSRDTDGRGRTGASASDDGNTTINDDDPTDIAALEVDAAGSQRGAPVGLLVGGGLLCALVAMTLVQMRRRRPGV